MVYVRPRQLLHSLIRNVYEYAIYHALPPMLLVAGVSLFIVLLGWLRDDPLVLTIGVSVGVGVACWALVAFAYVIVFSRWL
jgi:hypothetical protein